MLSNIQKNKFKSYCFLGLFLAAGTSSLLASYQQDLSPHNTQVELSYGPYRVSDSRYQDVYTEGAGIISLEIVRFLKSFHPHYIGAVGGVRRFSNTGYSTLTQEETRLKLHPLALGVRYFLKTAYLTPWIEIGMDHFLYSEKSDIHDTNGSTWGYHVQGGVYFPLPIVPSLSLKFAARHSKAVAKENGLNIDLGGSEFSFGLAFGFDLF